jgi:hypothetical protein
MEKKKNLPTLEEVWATLDRIAERMDRSSAEADKRNAEADKRNAEAAKRNAEADKRLKKLEKDIFGIGRNNGYYAEEFFQHVFSKKREFAGIKFDGMIPNLKYEGKESCEFDIVLVNGDCIAIIEAKYRVNPDFVEELVTKKLAQFRKYFPTYKNHAVYFGIAGLSFNKEVIKSAKERGVAIVRQDGQRVVVDSLPTKTY